LKYLLCIPRNNDLASTNKDVEPYFVVLIDALTSANRTSDKMFLCIS